MPVERLEELDGFLIKLGRKHYYFRGGETPFNNSCSANLALNKYCTNKVLDLAKIPVPKLTGIHETEFQEGKLRERIAHFKFPLVIKPLDGSKGNGVICNLKNFEELENYLRSSFASYKSMLIEEFYANLKSYRVLIFNRRVIGVVFRYPALVVGDGEHTLEQLIALANTHRKKINDALGNIVTDEECFIRLKEQNLNLDHIPQRGKTVYLGYTSNATRGGAFQTHKTRICKENRLLMVRAAEALNLNFVGLDVECTDIDIPIETSCGVIIEANHCPSIRIHEVPMSGAVTPVAKKIIRSLIYQHPLAYLYVLYTNRKTRFFMRSLSLIISLGVLYALFI